MSNDNIHSDELLKHLQEERNKQNVSLVGLMEGEKSIFSPATLATVIATLLSLVIGGTTWIINQESKISDLTRSYENLSSQYQSLSGRLDNFQTTTSNSLQNNAQVNSSSVSDLSSRFSEAISELSTNAKINQAATEQQAERTNMRLDNIQNTLSEIKKNNERRDTRIHELETQTKVLEGRYENLMRSLRRPSQ